MRLLLSFVVQNVVNNSDQQVFLHDIVLIICWAECGDDVVTICCAECGDDVVVMCCAERGEQQRPPGGTAAGGSGCWALRVHPDCH